MALADDVADLLRNVSLGDSARRRFEPASPPKSFLQSMNEKLAQKPRTPKRQHRFSRNSNDVQAADPARFYIVEDERQFMGVYSQSETATRAARIAGASEDFLNRWAREGLRQCWTKVRILPQKLHGVERSMERATEAVRKDEKSEKTGYRGDTSAEDANTEVTKPDNIAPGKDSQKDNIPKSTAPVANNDSKQDTNARYTPSYAPEKPIKSVYVALDGSLCLGLFTEKSRAWEACVKHKTQMTYSVDLKNESQWVDQAGMQYLQGMITGSGFHCWHIRLVVVDEIPQAWKRGSERWR